MAVGVSLVDSQNGLTDWRDSLFKNFMTEELAVYQNQSVIPDQASNDAQIIEMWLHGRGENTRKAYENDINDWFDYGVPFKIARLQDIQGYCDKLKDSGFKNSTISRKMAAIKSLLTFAHKIGYLPFNVGAVVKSPKVTRKLSQRILERKDVIRMIDREKNPRNQAFMRLLYVTGIRASEAINLRGYDVIKREDGGQITVTAKGENVRDFWIDTRTWEMLWGLIKLDGSSENNHNFVFRTSSGNRIHPVQAVRIIKAAGKRAGLGTKISPHWLRHATASHLHESGVSLIDIQRQLGHESIETTTLYIESRPTTGAAKYLAW